MKKLNIADWFSIYRIIAVPLIVIAVLLQMRDLTGWLLLISFSTDALDGILARSLKIETKHGARLDSAGDMLTFLTGAFGIFMFGTDKILENLMIIVIAVALYLIQFLIGVIKYGKASSLHTYSAKTAAVLQGIFLVTFHLHTWVDWLFWLAITISILETLEEIVVIFLLPKWETNVKGLYWVLRRKGRPSLQKRRK